MPSQSRGAVQWHGREPILTGESSAHASVRHLEKEWRSCATYGESSAVLPATVSARAWAVWGSPAPNRYSRIGWRLARCAGTCSACPTP